MDYKDVISQMRIENSPIPTKRFQFSIPNAKEELQNALKAVGEAMGENLKWLPEYDKIAEWMTDNKGKGILMYGVVGRGKSIMLRYVIPMIFRAKLTRIVTIVDCANQKLNIDEITQRKIIALDDIGAEPSQRKDYGTDRNVVIEAITKAQDNTDTMIIATTNLSATELRERYGERIFDRIVYLCCRVPFNGKSMRK